MRCCAYFYFLQKTCACGNHGDSKVIVQFYEELENGILDPYCKPPLKTPLCLGALISQKHVLTVKSCFGAKPNEESINKVKLKNSKRILDPTSKYKSIQVYKYFSVQVFK